MASEHENGINGVTNSSIREILAQLHDLRELMQTRFQAIEILNGERDRRYEQRFATAETAVSAALAAQEKAVNAAFLASEKAIIKAEDAQKENNSKTNEFRGQLSDQAATLMPRAETETRFKSVEEKIEDVKTSLFKKIEDEAAARIGMATDNRNAINDLRISRSQVEGRSLGTAAVIAYIISAVTVVGSIIGLVLALSR